MNGGRAQNKPQARPGTALHTQGKPRALMPYRPSILRFGERTEGLLRGSMSSFILGPEAGVVSYLPGAGSEIVADHQSQTEGE